MDVVASGSQSSSNLNLKANAGTSRTLSRIAPLQDEPTFSLKQRNYSLNIPDAHTAITPSIENLARPTLNMPIDPPKSSTKTETRIVWEKEVDEYVRKKTHLNENLKTLYPPTVAWGNASMPCAPE
jgi:hypothetical protein